MNQAATKPPSVYERGIALVTTSSAAVCHNWAKTNLESLGNNFKRLCTNTYFFIDHIVFLHELFIAAAKLKFLSLKIVYYYGPGFSLIYL